MKKTILSLLSLLMAGSTLMAQHQMHISLKDGTVQTFDVTDVDSIYWSEKVADQHEAVDLGLSVKWATCNVGATSPEEYGDYFAWGETTAKTDYSSSTYKYWNGSYDKQTKYCTSSDYGTVDNKIVLESSDDAATANWGGTWRMPTMAEQDELYNNCTWTWTTQNGVEGYKVTGKNGNSIFLPAAGYRDVTSLYRDGFNGCYWSSSLNTSYSYFAYSQNFNSGGIVLKNCGRRGGNSVRPVCP